MWQNPGRTTFANVDRKVAGECDLSLGGSDLVRCGEGVHACRKNQSFSSGRGRVRHPPTPVSGNPRIRASSPRNTGRDRRRCSRCDECLSGQGGEKSQCWMRGRGSMGREGRGAVVLPTIPKNSPSVASPLHRDSFVMHVLARFCARSLATCPGGVCIWAALLSRALCWKPCCGPKM